LIRSATEVGVDLPKQADEPPLRLLSAMGTLSSGTAPSFGNVSRQLVETYRQLTTEEGRRLARDTIRVWRADPQDSFGPFTHDFDAEEILLHLACLVPGSLRGSHGELIKRGIFSPPKLYLGTDDATRDRLLRLVEGSGPRVEALAALAWIGDDAVQAAFHRWLRFRTWDTEVTRRIEWFTRDAGWELTVAGKRRMLYHQRCYRLVAIQSAPPEVQSGPVKVILPHAEQCGWCHHRLLTLFDIDMRDSRLQFLAPGWRRLRIPFCARCTGFGTIFVAVDPQGGAHWSRFNAKPVYIGTEEHRYPYPQHRLVLGPARRTPFEADTGVLTEGGSQLGGFPMWVQGNSHPDCPKCRRLMVFVGQIQTEDALGMPAEGVTYAFLCQDCRIAATTYEQT
jgi:hypothetical protein